MQFKSRFDLMISAPLSHRRGYMYSGALLMLLFIVYWLYYLFLGLPARGLKSLGSEKHPNHTGNIKTQNQPDENWARSLDLRIRFPFISPTGSTQVGEGGTFQSFDEIKIHHLLSFFHWEFFFQWKGRRESLWSCSLCQVECGRNYQLSLSYMYSHEL